MPTEFDAASLPTKRTAAGVLLRDLSSRVLLVEPTYRDTWEIPGGMIEPGESPREAARRECLEELGREIPIGDLLCVHYTEGDGVMFVFDAGQIDLNPDDLDLPHNELRSAEFTPPGCLGSRVAAGMTVRLKAAIDAAATGTVSYLER